MAENNRPLEHPDSVLSPVDPSDVAPLLTPRVKLALFAVLIFSVLIFFGTVAFRDSTVYYLTVSELSEQGSTAEGRLVRVAGKLVNGSYTRSANGLDVSFQIRDEQGTIFPVGYVGEVGQLFFNDHSELIVEGAYGSDGIFKTETLIVKCPTKYVNVQDDANEVAGEEVVPSYQTEVRDSESGA